MDGKEFKVPMNGNGSNGNGVEVSHGLKVLQDRKKTTMAGLTPKELPTWCGGCGDFNILFTIKNTLVELDIDPASTAIFSGIGCGSKTPHFIKTYGFEGLHGRSLPVATGTLLANHHLNVIVVTGDGDGYGIGGNHLIHTMRRNFNMTHIIQNNEVYGLTKGQYSPTSPAGFRSPSTPQGAIDTPVNPISLAITMGATYVARGYAYEVKHLQKLLADGIRHKGYALIDVFQPCSTYNKINTIAWYKEHLYKLEDSGHDPADKMLALSKAMGDGDKLPIGLFYRENRPTYEDSMPQLNGVPLVKKDISDIDITPMLQRFK